MSTLRVSKIQTAAVDEDLTLTTGNTIGPSFSLSSANDNIYFNGTAVFETASFAPIEAYETANNAATTGKAIAMAIVFG